LSTLLSLYFRQRSLTKILWSGSNGSEESSHILHENENLVNFVSTA